METQPSAAASVVLEGDDGLDSLVSPEDHPVLHALLNGPDADDARRELAMVLETLQRRRAPRFEASLRAQLLVGGERTVDVDIQDVSASGMRVRVPYGNEIDVMAADDVSFILGSDDDSTGMRLRLRAAMVRVAGTDERGVSLGFRFLDATGRESAWLDGLLSLDERG